MNRKVLVQYIEASTIDLYVNSITHCILNENITELFFAVNNESSERNFIADEIIVKIKNRLEELSNNEEIYIKPLEMMRNINLKSMKIYQNFNQMTNYLYEISKKFDSNDTIIIDVSAVSKQLFIDIVSSGVLNKFDKVYAFILSDKVYDKDLWKKGKIYHDLVIGEVKYYEYTDFTKIGYLPLRINEYLSENKSKSKRDFMIFIGSAIFGAGVSGLFTEILSGKLDFIIVYLIVLFIGLLLGIFSYMKMR